MMRCAGLALMLAASLACAAPPGPAGAKINFSASGVAPELLKDTAPAPRARAAAPPVRGSGGAMPVDPWKRQLGGGPEQEDESCILNFGIGGALGGKGSVGSHFLGRSQVWREEAPAGASK
jgi:hypothetical protein